MQHYKYKDGSRSKHAIPERLQERAQMAAEDPDLFELKTNMTLLQARRDELVSLLDTGESGSLWEKLDDAYTNLLAANQIKDVETMNAVLVVIGDLIQRGSSDSEKWTEVLDILDRQRRMSESDAKIKAKLQQYMTVDQGMALLGLVGSICESLIDAYLPKNEAKRFIVELSDALSSVANRQPGRPPLAAIPGRSREIADTED